MARLLQGIGDDLRFVRSHPLQPKGCKTLKVFILLGFLLGCGSLFGLKRTAVFLTAFLLLSLGVHLPYRTGTHGWQRSWQDFVVAKQDGEIKPQRIGIFTYLAIVLNAALSVVASHRLAYTRRNDRPSDPSRGREEMDEDSRHPGTFDPWSSQMPPKKAR